MQTSQPDADPFHASSLAALERTRVFGDDASLELECVRDNAFEIMAMNYACSFFLLMESSRTLARLGPRNADFGVVGLASGGIWRGTFLHRKAHRLTLTFTSPATSNHPHCDARPLITNRAPSYVRASSRLSSRQAERNQLSIIFRPDPLRRLFFKGARYKELDDLCHKSPQL